MVATHRWGVLGTAQITPAFIEGLRRIPRAELVAVASRDPGRGEAFARLHDIPVVHRSYEALLNAQDLDSVYVPLPNSLHKDWTVRALEAGKHVLCEKPLVTRTEDAIFIEQTSKRTGRYVMEGFMHRHHPQWALLKEAMQQGLLGELVSIDSWFTFPLDPEELGPASAELGGGALFDVGCYCVHLSRTLAGGEPLEVMAMQRGEPVDRTMQGILRMPDNVLARFECSIEQDERRGARVTGSKATAIIERPWLPGDDSACIRIEANGVLLATLRSEPAHCHQLQLEAFIRAAESGDWTRWPIEDAVHNAQVLQALRLSAHSGHSVSLPGAGA